MKKILRFVVVSEHNRERRDLFWVLVRLKISPVTLLVFTFKSVKSRWSMTH